MGDDEERPDRVSDEKREVILHRFREARDYGLTRVEAHLFADSEIDVGVLRRLRALGCPPGQAAKILLCLLVSVVALFATVGQASAAAPRAVHRYQTGQPVKNLTWLLAGHKPSIYRIQAWRHPITSVYDKRVAAAVTNDKFRLGFPATALGGNVAGARFIAYLKGKPRPYSYKLEAGRRVVALQKARYNLAHPPVSAKVALLVADARYLISHRDLIGYTQSSLRMTIVRTHLRLPPLTHYIWEDCSSSVTGLYWLAGLPDPNGLGFNGWGYTGTEASHGRVVWQLGQPLSQLRPGDLIFYGGGWPHHHVTMYLGNGRVFSHGTSTGPFDLSVLYRSDAVGAHRYVN